MRPVTGVRFPNGTIRSSALPLRVFELPNVNVIVVCADGIYIEIDLDSKTFGGSIYCRDIEFERRYDLEPQLTISAKMDISPYIRKYDVSGSVSELPGEGIRCEMFPFFWINLK